MVLVFGPSTFPPLSSLALPVMRVTRLIPVPKGRK